MNIPILKYCFKKKRTGRGSTGSFLAFVQIKKYIVEIPFVNVSKNK